MLVIEHAFPRFFSDYLGVKIGIYRGVAMYARTLYGSFREGAPAKRVGEIACIAIRDSNT